MKSFEQEAPTLERGKIFKSCEDFYNEYIAVGLNPIVRIYEKKVEKGSLIYDPIEFVDARAPKITESSANLNIYQKRETATIPYKHDAVIATLRLTNKNIAHYRIEVING